MLKNIFIILLSAQILAGTVQRKDFGCVTQNMFIAVLGLLILDDLDSVLEPFQREYCAIFEPGDTVYLIEYGRLFRHSRLIKVYYPKFDRGYWLPMESINFLKGAK
jgi:hypothetical protein